MLHKRTCIVSLWNVPLADIDLSDDEIRAVTDVLRSKWLSMGPVTAEFERQFAAMVGVKHAFAVTNCTAALHLAQQHGWKSCPTKSIPAAQIEQAIWERTRAIAPDENVTTQDMRKIVERVQKAVREIGDLEKPLGQLALFDQRARAPAAAVDHLLIGKHGMIDRVPIDLGFFAQDEACVQKI